MAENFFDLLWPSPPIDGILSVSRKVEGKGFIPLGFFSTSQFDKAHDFIIAQSEHYDVYTTLALLNRQPERGRGAAEDIGYVSSFFMDLDVYNPANPQAHKEEKIPQSIEEVDAFLTEIAIPASSAIIDSGNGRHVHWFLDKPMLAKDAAVAHRKFQETVIRLASEKRGWKFDNTSDLARVLRAPDTLNHKNGIVQKVTLLEAHKDRRYSADCLAAWVATHAPAPAAKRKGRGTEKKADFGAVRAGCAQVDDLTSRMEAGEQLPYPEWYLLALVLRHCADGGEIFHGLSQRDSRYSEAETNEKLAGDAGATLCETIQATCGREKCSGCPLNGQGKSPISLGMEAFSKVLQRYVLVADPVGYYDLAAQAFLSPRTMDAEYGHLFADEKGRVHETLAMDARTQKARSAEYLPGQYDRIEEREHGVRVLNTWNPSPLVARDGECSTLLRHFQLMIPDDIIQRYLLNCLAYMLQHPGKKIKHAFLLTGTQGTGKSLLYQLVASLLRERNCHVIRGEKFGETFNAHMIDHQLLIVEELPISHKLDTYNTVKGLITRAIE